MPLHDPKQNNLLAALPPAEYDDLLADLSIVFLKAKEVIAKPGEPSGYSYFPIDCTISIYHDLEQGAPAGIMVVGNEGMFSAAHYMGGNAIPYLAMIETSGHAFRMEASILKDAFNRNEALKNTLLLYAQASITQISQAVVCSRHHSLLQQLCLHLLLVQDNSLSDDFRLTHEAIALMLGVRREGITEAAGKLRSDGVIDYYQGHIKVIDRARLEGLCCECYEVVHKEFASLLGDRNHVRQTRS
ncbi:MAG: Crp/Fnr family transcriptional regulator [Gallionellales bacterium RIFCSPLOWO2_12_FULL_59_22]|nr:MAG: Crp/Fnr family transcriptional regulator [Gallionellales bacterium RIFCSPLOWO2_02_FULL_59_110]OGT01350.1 MAG: Crp/Fnr family transcriptional regulator [Gallionellales bacterium RIFCSPLOWO2_02_58_13]OGT10839.1 MAG: Crp/Fnr family transcriptional regulator [Gallionellales bacterium RIFCSPLOWO2_12_FULL_59_22]